MLVGMVDQMCTFRALDAQDLRLEGKLRLMRALMQVLGRHSFVDGRTGGESLVHRLLTGRCRLPQTAVTAHGCDCTWLVQAGPLQPEHLRMYCWRARLGCICACTAGGEDGLPSFLSRILTH